MKAEEIIPVARRLELTGMARSQAETVVCVVQEAVSELATKADLAASERRLREDMKSVESSIREDMKSVESSIRDDMKSVESSIRDDMKSVESSIRDDMENLKESLRKEMKDLDKSIRSSVKSDMAKMETRLFWKLSGAILAMCTFMSTFIFAVLRFVPLS